MAWYCSANDLGSALMRVFVLFSASLEDYNRTPIFSMERNAKAFCAFSKKDVHNVVTHHQ
jgi:hypothetical protein